MHRAVWFREQPFRSKPLQCGFETNPNRIYYMKKADESLFPNPMPFTSVTEVKEFSPLGWGSSEPEMAQVVHVFFSEGHSDN